MNPRVFWEDTRQPVERRRECRAAHTSTLATALTPLLLQRTSGTDMCIVNTNVRTSVRTYTCTMVTPFTQGTRHGTLASMYVHVYVRTYTCTYVRTCNVMSQLSDWKRAHMCTENHVCFGRIHGSQLREGANAGQHTPTLSLPPSHHCLDGEVQVYVLYHGTRVRTRVFHTRVPFGTMVLEYSRSQRGAMTSSHPLSGGAQMTNSGRFFS